MDVQIGSPMTLDFGDPDAPVEASFIGFVKPDFIIVRLRDGERSPAFKPGQSLTASYISSGVVYRIKTSILDYTRKFDLFFLTYPATYETENLRCEDRVSCNIPATASIEKSALKGLVTDISRHGCRFVVKIPTTFKLYRVSVLTDINLTLSEFGNPTDATKIKGKVRNTSVDEFKIALGIEFEALEERISRRLTSFIDGMKILN